MKKHIVLCLVLSWSYVQCMEDKRLTHCSRTVSNPHFSVVQQTSEDQEEMARRIQRSKSTGSPVECRVKKQASLETLLQEEGCKEALRMPMVSAALRTIIEEKK